MASMMTGLSHLVRAAPRAPARVASGAQGKRPSCERRAVCVALFALGIFANSRRDLCFTVLASQESSEVSAARVASVVARNWQVSQLFCSRLEIYC